MLSVKHWSRFSRYTAQQLHHKSTEYGIFCYDSNILVRVMTFRSKTRAIKVTNSLSHLSRVLRVHFVTTHRRLAQKQ